MKAGRTTDSWYILYWFHVFSKLDGVASGQLSISNNEYSVPNSGFEQSNAIIAAEVLIIIENSKINSA